LINEDGLHVDAADNQWMRLIERESQRAALHLYAGEASQGEGRLVLISGEAGAGKSVLLEEFAQELDEARWLWADCDGLFTPAALGPLLDIANPIDGELLRLCHAEAKRDQLYGARLSTTRRPLNSHRGRYRGRPLGGRGNAGSAELSR
jgi:hypothetical protein